LSKQKRPERDRRRPTVEINLLGETKGRTGLAAKRRGCLGLGGGVFVVTLAALLGLWAGLH
jgi:hypothetical protein